jgi:hypothetical protein
MDFFVILFPINATGCSPACGEFSHDEVSFLERVRAKTLRQNRLQREELLYKQEYFKKRSSGIAMTHCRDPHSTETSLGFNRNSETYALIYLVAGVSKKNIGAAQRVLPRGAHRQVTAHSLKTGSARKK